jgi:hypothetical protein
MKKQPGLLSPLGSAKPTTRDFTQRDAPHSAGAGTSNL